MRWLAGLGTRELAGARELTGPDFDTLWLPRLLDLLRRSCGAAVLRPKPTVVCAPCTACRAVRIWSLRSRPPKGRSTAATTRTTTSSPCGPARDGCVPPAVSGRRRSRAAMGTGALRSPSLDGILNYACWFSSPDRRRPAHHHHHQRRPSTVRRRQLPRRDPGAAAASTTPVAGFA